MDGYPIYMGYNWLWLHLWRTLCETVLKKGAQTFINLTRWSAAWEVRIFAVFGPFEVGGRRCRSNKMAAKSLSHPNFSVENKKCSVKAHMPVSLWQCMVKLEKSLEIPKNIFEFCTSTIIIGFLLSRWEEVFHRFAEGKGFAICDDPGFEKCWPLCYKCPRNHLSEKSGEILVDLNYIQQQKHSKLIIFPLSFKITKTLWILFIQSYQACSVKESGEDI